MGKNVDLKLLSEQVIGFFEKKYFKTKSNTLKTGFAIYAVTENNDEPGVVVRIHGSSNDFMVEFSASEPRGSKLGLILSFLGGGGFLLRSLESQERLEKLEREFWAFLDDQLSS